MEFPKPTKSAPKITKTAHNRYQKFSALPLSLSNAGTNKETPLETNSTKKASNKNVDKKYNVEDFLEDTLFDDINLTQMLLASTGTKKSIGRSNSEEIVPTNPPVKGDRKRKIFSAKSHGDVPESNSTATGDVDPFNDTMDTTGFSQLTQMLKKSGVGVQLSKSSLLEQMKSENCGDILNESNREQIESFFDQIEHSVSRLGTQSEHDENIIKLLEALSQSFCDKKDDETVSQEDVTLSGINASFASALKQVFLANKSRKNVSVIATNDTLNEKEVKFEAAGPFYGLPSKVKELMMMYRGIEKLYDWQDECLNLPAVKNRKNLIYALPTSGGKTLVAEILMLREVICYKRNALFILPYVALVQEKIWALSPFAVALDFLVEEYAASKGAYPPRKRRRKNSIYIATIEKALGLLNSLIETERVNEIGLVVVDELHLVGEQGRGSTLEALLAKIRFIKADAQVIGMSATIGNVNDLCTFLDAEMYTGNFRPVELVEYVKCGPDIAKIDYSKKQELLTVVRTMSDRSFPHSINNMDPDKLGALVTEVIPQDSCLIFCASKKNCENVAYLLCKIVDKKLLDHRKEEKQQVKNNLKDEGGALCKIFNVSIQLGIAYHHSGLTNEERRVIEEAFRDGIISVICCTSTLAAGVNLPAKRVILRQPYVGRDFISLSKYKQMVGRAGRAGLGERGDSILICNCTDLPKVRKLLMSPMDEALSSMHEEEGRGLRHLLLSCISLGIANTRAQLQQVSKNTLLSIQSERLGVNLKKLTDQVISGLFKLGALQEADLSKAETNINNCDVTVKMDTSFGNSSFLASPSPVPTKKRKILLKNDTKLVISTLGCAAIKGNFDLRKAHLLYDDLHDAQKSLVLLDSLHLLYLVTPYDLAEQIKPNKNDYYNIYCKLGKNELHTARVLGIDDAVAMKMLANQPIKTVPERVLNRFYLTLVLNDLWNEKTVFAVSEKFQLNRGIVQHLMTGSATFGSNVVHFCEQLEEFWTFASLLKGMSQRIAHCCVRELLPLMELPAVKQSRARQLYNAGFKSIRSIAAASVESLEESIDHMPRRVAKQMIAAAKMLLLEKVENLREEAEDVLEGVENPKSLLNHSVL